MTIKTLYLCTKFQLKHAHYYMRNMFFLILFFFSIGSCTISHSVVVTNNPVGSKTVSMEYTNWDSQQGATYESIMKKGEIKKLGVAEYKSVYNVFFRRSTLTITGN